MHKVFTTVVCLCSLWLPAARALDRTHLGVIINTRDPQSVEVGNYYAAQRQISFQNIIRVSFTPIENSLTRERFNLIEAQALLWALSMAIPAIAMVTGSSRRCQCWPWNTSGSA